MKLLILLFILTSNAYSYVGEKSFSNSDKTGIPCQCELKESNEYNHLSKQVYDLDGDMETPLGFVYMVLKHHEDMLENAGDDYLNGGFKSFTVSTYSNVNEVITLYVDGQDLVILNTITNADTDEWLDSGLVTVKTPKALK